MLPKESLMNIDLNTQEDLDQHINYTQNHGRYLTDIENEDVATQIKKNFAPAQCFDEMFDEQEIQWMQGYAFSRCRKLRVNPNGTFFISGNLRGVYEKFSEKFEKILPGSGQSPVVKGNYFITPEQYGLHNDSIRKKDWTSTFEKFPYDHEDRRWVPWRNVVIPLMIYPVVDNHVVFFEQRHISWFTVYNHGAENVGDADYPIITDYSKIQFETLKGKQDVQQNIKPYDPLHWEKYLNYTPYQRLTGLTQESTVEWKPRCPMVFDCFQLHATNQGLTNKTWKIKMGLLMCFFKRIK